MSLSDSSMNNVGNIKDTDLVLHHKSNISWDDAFQSCINNGRMLYDVQSVASRQILLENVHDVFQWNHFEFWKAQIVFVDVLYNDKVTVLQCQC